MAKASISLLRYSPHQIRDSFSQETQASNASWKLKKRHLFGVSVLLNSDSFGRSGRHKHLTVLELDERGLACFPALPVPIVLLSTTTHFPLLSLISLTTVSRIANSVLLA